VGKWSVKQGDRGYNSTELARRYRALGGTAYQSEPLDEFLLGE
jgi:hypothetical protein